MPAARDPAVVAEPVEILSPDPHWPRRFEQEAARLRAVLPVDIDLRLEHFGSTAVPGLAAKPILDILVICDDRPAWERLRAPILSQGYRFQDDDEPDHQVYVKGAPRSHHLHVRPLEGARRHLAFRDALRASRDFAEEYESLKRALATRFRHDRVGYTQRKSDFVERVLSGCQGFRMGNDELLRAKKKATRRKPRR